MRIVQFGNGCWGIQRRVDTLLNTHYEYLVLDYSSNNREWVSLEGTDIDDICDPDPEDVLSFFEVMKEDCQERQPKVVSKKTVEVEIANRKLQSPPQKESSEYSTHSSPLNNIQSILDELNQFDDIYKNHKHY